MWKFAFHFPRLFTTRSNSMRQKFLQEPSYRRARVLTALALLAGLSALAMAMLVPAQSAEAALKPAASLCPNPGVFTGTNSSGNLQAALDDAIAKAETCAGCCDMLVTWEVQEISGRRGGIAGFNDLNVKIVASW
jgi:hypothetical protein